MSSSAVPRLLITGANGHLGRRLIKALGSQYRVTALVRSERAKGHLQRAIGSAEATEIVVGDPSEAKTLQPLLNDAAQIVHLIGTIKARADNSIADSHETPAKALAAALALHSTKHILYISIVGADPASDSQCLRSRARVEAILNQAAAPCSVLRVPMVLGEGDRASKALQRRAGAERVFVFRGASLEQPIYAGDVVQAMRQLLDNAPSANQLLELAGPESLSRIELITRAARALGKAPPKIYSLPLACGLLTAFAFEKLLANPPLTRDMLRVLDHDDQLDVEAGSRALNLELTPLDTVLERCLASPSGARLSDPPAT